MFTPFPCKHLKNTDEHITSNILVTLYEGGGHHRDLRPEPFQKVRHGRLVGNSTHLSLSAATEASVSHQSSASLLRRESRKRSSFARSVFSTSDFFATTAACKEHTSPKSCFKILIDRGQSQFTALNLRQFQLSGVKLHAQLSFGLFQLFHTCGLLHLHKFLSNLGSCQVQHLEKNQYAEINITVAK
jgi:hypothetical protein